MGNLRAPATFHARSAINLTLRHLQRLSERDRVELWMVKRCHRLQRAAPLRALCFGLWYSFYGHWASHHQLTRDYMSNSPPPTPTITNSISLSRTNAHHARWRQIITFPAKEEWVPTCWNKDGLNRIRTDSFCRWQCLESLSKLQTRTKT